MFPVVDRLVCQFGSQEALSAACGVTRVAVAQWKRRGNIPARHQRAILLAARERGLDITAEDLIGVERAQPTEAA